MVYCDVTTGGAVRKTQVSTRLLILTTADRVIPLMEDVFKTVNNINLVKLGVSNAVK